MKTMNWKMASVLAFGVVCLFFACEDRSRQGEDIFPQDVEDMWTTADSSVEPDGSPTDGVASDDDVWSDTAHVLTAGEYCAPYIGTWDCVCVGDGGCHEGTYVPYLVELLQVNGNGTWTFWVTDIHSGANGPVTCDPLKPPPNDGAGYWMKMSQDDTSHMTNWDGPPGAVNVATAECTRLE